jgi:hypothetical protein
MRELRYLYRILPLIFAVFVSLFPASKQIKNKRFYDALCRKITLTFFFDPWGLPLGRKKWHSYIAAERLPFTSKRVTNKMPSHILPIFKHICGLRVAALRQKRVSLFSYKGADPWVRKR